MDDPRLAEIAELKARLAAMDQFELTKKGILSSAFLWVAMVIGICLLFLLIIGLTAKPETGADRVAKIDKACADEYGSDQDAVMQCQLALKVKAIQKYNDDRALRAANAAGQ